MRRLIFLVLVIITLAACGSPNAKFQRWTSAQVVDSLKAASLEVNAPRAMTKEDYGIAPMRAADAMFFGLPSLCDTCGGRVLAFSNADDLKKTEAFYVELGKGSAMLFSWTFAKDNILIQLNGDLAEDKAKAYESALNSMK